MGCIFSSNSINNPPTSSSRAQSISNSVLKSDLSSYQNACRSDPELQSFDSVLQDRTTRVIYTLAGGAEVHSLSLDSLREVTGSLLDMNQEVVKVILNCKKDIWKNDELFSLVEDFFAISLQTLDFCTSLENCLRDARSSLSFLQIAINQFYEDSNYLNTIEQFKKFKSLDTPFSEEFSKSFQSVYKQQILMLKKLQTQKGKVDKKLKSVKGWKRLSNVILIATFGAILICSVVAAAVAAPPVLTALAATAALPLGSVGTWVSSLWRKYEKELREQSKMMSSMEIENYIVIKDLDNIKTLVDKLGIEMEGLLQNAEFAIREEEEEAVATVVDEMKKTVKEFAKTIENLSDHSDKCSRDVRRARAVILQRIINRSSE